MKMNREISLSQTAVAFTKACRKLTAHISKTKEKLLTEFKGTFQAHEHLLRLALNEAEALAWQTGYPQLVFADLAIEKAQALADWQQKQVRLH